MRSAPRKVSDEQELYAAALRALTRRAHSTFEMRTYLERRAEDAELARRIVNRLKQENLIDDGRYALEFARLRANLRRQGRHRIARELRTRGVPDRHIEAALEQVFAETDEALLVRKVIERRLRLASKGGAEARGADANLDAKKIASLYRALMRSGFDAALIRREIEAATRATAADAEAPDFAALEESS